MSAGGLTQHIHSAHSAGNRHQQPSPPVDHVEMPLGRGMDDMDNIFAGGQGSDDERRSPPAAGHTTLHPLLDGRFFLLHFPSQSVQASF